MKPRPNPLRYESKYEEVRWNAADALARGFLAHAATLFDEAAEIAPSEDWKADCLKLARTCRERIGR